MRLEKSLLTIRSQIVGQFGRTLFVLGSVVSSCIYRCGGIIELLNKTDN